MRGTYTILLKCKKSMWVRFGKLGQARLAKGHYLYTGSALGQGAVSLEGRLRRHGRVSKRVRWHVDYLTSRPECEVKAVVYIVSRRRFECKINHSICNELEPTLILRRLGASDCNCDAHLIRPGPRLSEAKLVDKLKRIYSRLGVPFLVFMDARPKLTGLLPIASGTHPERL